MQSKYRKFKNIQQHVHTHAQTFLHILYSFLSTRVLKIIQLILVLAVEEFPPRSIF